MVLFGAQTKYCKAALSPSRWSCLYAGSSFPSTECITFPLHSGLFRQRKVENSREILPKPKSWVQSTDAGKFAQPLVSLPLTTLELIWLRRWLSTCCGGLFLQTVSVKCCWVHGATMWIVETIFLALFDLSTRKLTWIRFGFKMLSVKWQWQ